MYIHRIVIDANRINARGGLPAMTALEALHHAGVIEIFQTSTLPVEFKDWPLGKEKASAYAVVGGSVATYLTSDGPDSQLGTPSQLSLFSEIHRIAFGGFSRSTRTNDLRDALHIDQANQNHADFFLTNEKALIAADADLRSVGLEVRICDVDDCLLTLQDFFKRDYGTTDISLLRARLESVGPVLLGSNSCCGTEFLDAKSGESLLAFLPSDNGVSIRATLRTAEGHIALSIAPGSSLQFHGSALKVYSSVGPSPVQLGDHTCRSFSIVDKEERPYMAARMLRNGRLMLYQLKLYNSDGQLVVELDRATLGLNGVTIRPVAATSA